MLLITCFLFSNSCKKEDQSIIDSDFQDYVDRFVNEADSRNIKIDISKLTVSYGDTLKINCVYSIPNEVLINQLCWNNLNGVQKELFLFHEFGHALLARIDDNSKLPNGDFTSIMNNQDLRYLLYSELTPERRIYYLDQLFTPSVPLPEWSANKTIPTVIFKDTIQRGSPLWQFISGPGNTFTSKFCSTIYFSPGTSLSIEPSNSLEGWAYWNYDYIPQGINQSDKLVLSARIKTVGVTKGGGVTLLMGGFDANNNRVFFTFKTDSGTMDFTEWKAEVPYYVSAKSIYIRFVLDRSQGITYLDDVTLTKFE